MRWEWGHKNGEFDETTLSTATVMRMLSGEVGTDTDTDYQNAAEVEVEVG